VDLSGEQAQVDAAQRLRPAEALREPPDLEARLCLEARLRLGLRHRYFRPQSFW
jgi:hypothetical protein